MIARRSLIGLMPAAFLAARPAVLAQTAAKPFTIGFLWLAAPDAAEPLIKALAEGLAANGLIEGRDYVFVRRHGDGTTEKASALAAELAGLRPDVIFAGANLSIAAVRQATKTIPIVMGNATDPVGAGFVASLSSPGGNVTGLANDPGPEIQVKRLEILAEMIPGLRRVAVLLQSGSGTALQQLRAAAPKGVDVQAFEVGHPGDLDGAFTAMTRNSVNAIVVGAGPLTFLHRQRIADLAIRHRLPAIHTVRESVESGLLASYGPSFVEMYRRAAYFIARILRGTKPGTLPVEQPSKFELILNMRTARLIGVDVPQLILARADEVIE